MKKTKIVCTLGPSSSDYDVLRKMVESGADVMRFNLSHGTHEEHRDRIELVRRISADLGRPIGVMVDLQGPKIRTGDLEGGEVMLTEGQEVELTTEPVLGRDGVIPVLYHRLYTDVRPGGSIMLDDGLIELSVLEVRGDRVRCLVVTGGALKSRKGVCLQCVKIDLPAITDKDRLDIDFGVQNEVDFFAISFVRTAEDVRAVRQMIADRGSDAEVIAKIESVQALENLDEIIEAADAVMIARGDLGIEMPPEEVPVMQSAIIRKCNEQGKPVITATQMLESMKHSPLPTRAEVADVSGAIMQGSDAVMLSGESAVGDYPVAAVRMMARIARRIERELPFDEMLGSRAVASGASIADAICHSACVTAEKLGLAAIISSTNSGSTARNVAKYRPRSPVIAATPNVRVANRLSLVWGVTPVVVGYRDNTDSIVECSVEAAVQRGLASRGDLVAITAGIGPTIPAPTNFVRVHRV